MFGATWAVDDIIIGMKELTESLTRKAGDEFLEKMLDSAGVIYYKRLGAVFVTLA